MDLVNRERGRQGKFKAENASAKGLGGDEEDGRDVWQRHPGLPHAQGSGPAQHAWPRTAFGPGPWRTAILPGHPPWPPLPPPPSPFPAAELRGCTGGGSQGAAPAGAVGAAVRCLSEQSRRVQSRSNSAAADFQRPEGNSACAQEKGG